MTCLERVEEALIGAIAWIVVKALEAWEAITAESESE